MTIVKTGTLDNTVVAPSSRTDAGDKIDYVFTVTNTGNVTLTNVTITDPAFPSLSCTIPSLAPGATWNGCSASTTLTQTQVDAGFVSNTANVSGTPPAGATPSPTTASDDETVIITRSPSVSIVKTGTLDNDDVAPASRTDAGDKITYTFVITNTGNVTLSGVAVTDPLPGLSAISCPAAAATLSPGESQTCTASLVLNQAHVDAGSVGNTATVSGTPPAGATPSPTTASDDEVVTITQVASLDLTKTASPMTYNTVGQTITYTFAVRNTGNVTLDNVAVTDPRCSAAPVYSTGDMDNDDELDVNETWLFTCTYAVTQADINAGSLTNTATATATGPQGQPATDTDSETINVRLVSTSQMTNSAFQLVDDLSPWAVPDFEILLNGQNIVAATNPGQFYYHQRATSPYSIPTNWTFQFNWPCQFESQVNGGQPMHAYIQLATDGPNTWRPWGESNTVTNVAFPGGCAQPAGTPYGQGTITVNNVPAGAKVWVNIHLDYAPKGDNISTVNPNPMTKPVVYGPFSSTITIKNAAGATVGTSFSSTSLIGRGKKVTMVYGTLTNKVTGLPVSDTWVRITQGTNSATALTGADGFYIAYDGQTCTLTDGLAGGCTGFLDDGVELPERLECEHHHRHPRRRRHPDRDRNPPDRLLECRGPDRDELLDRQEPADLHGRRGKGHGLPP